MTRWAIGLMVLLMALTCPARADITGVTEEDDGAIAGVSVQPIRGGRWEVTPIFSMRFNGGDFFYRAGVAVAYSINRYHQVGGSFVAGNREYDRLAGRDFTDVSQTVTQDAPDVRGRYFSVDEGFGSSVSAFYRLNVPLQIEKRTFPYVEVFGGRDFWGWGDVSELGGAVGVRKVVSRRMALTTAYGYSVLFSNGQHINRHVVTAGVSMFFR